MVLKISDLTDEEYWLPGNPACHGCGETIGLRMLGKALEGRFVLIVPAGCTAITQGPYPRSAAKFPLMNIAFAASAAAASGISAYYDLKGIDVPVVVWAGDGGTADIGIQALSGVAERGDNVLFICCDNEAYGNTGMQRSGATPYGAWTTTTVTGKTEHKKDMPMIMMAHNIPYVATASVAYPLDFVEKVRKAVKKRGLKYIHLQASCVPGWRIPSAKSVEVARLAVESGMWVLYEVEDGKFTLTARSAFLLDKSKRKPVRNYLAVQGRFAHLTEEQVEEIERYVDAQWERIKRFLSA